MLFFAYSSSPGSLCDFDIDKIKATVTKDNTLRRMIKFHLITMITSFNFKNFFAEQQIGADTNTHCKLGFSTCLTQLGQVALWKTFSPHSIPVKLTRWHKMEGRFGFHVIQFLFCCLFKKLSRCQPIIFSLPCSPALEVLFSISVINTLTHTHAEVRSPPCSSSRSTWRRREGGQEDRVRGVFVSAGSLCL